MDRVLLAAVSVRGAVSEECYRILFLLRSAHHEGVPAESVESFWRSDRLASYRQLLAAGGEVKLEDLQTALGILACVLKFAEMKSIGCPY